MLLLMFVRVIASDNGVFVPPAWDVSPGGVAPRSEGALFMVCMCMWGSHVKQWALVLTGRAAQVWQVPSDCAVCRGAAGAVSKALCTALLLLINALAGLAKLHSNASPLGFAGPPVMAVYDTACA